MQAPNQLIPSKDGVDVDVLYLNTRVSMRNSRAAWYCNYLYHQPFSGEATHETDSKALGSTGANP